jgi:asparagine synthase (glutamine-hydrolysing)
MIVIKNVQLSKSKPQRWYHHKQGAKEIWVLGKIFYGDDLLEGLSFAQLFLQLNDYENETVSEILRKLNGNFSVVIKDGDIVVAAVDRFRGSPLFYGIKNGDFYLSDDAYWVKDKVGDIKFDPVSEAEFLLLGYVTGQDTLYSNVKQIQAGEVITVGKQEVTTKRYISYVYTETFDGDQSKAATALDKIMHDSFTRLVRWANGRTLVVPLSGGYDSRAIILMLKKLNYKNIITFSFGLRGNKEAEISKNIATELGVPWAFAEYSNETVYGWFRSQEKIDYYRFADRLCAQPAFAALLALKELKEKCLIPDDSIFLPGHTVCLTSVLTPRYKCASHRLVSDIVNECYSLWSWNIISEEASIGLKRKIRKNIQEFINSKSGHNANSFQSWCLTERQTKLIVQANSEYNFFGFDCYMPLWDSDLFDFWLTLPMDIRRGKKPFKSFVDFCGEKLDAGQINNEVYMKKPFVVFIKNFFKGIPFLYECLKFWYRNVSLIKRMLYKDTVYFQDPWAVYGVMSEKQFLKLYTGKETKMSFYVLEYLGRIKYD